jgi:hypothetical protein
MIRLGLLLLKIHNIYIKNTMSSFAKKGWHYIPDIISKQEAIQIKYQNLMGAIHDLGGLKTHYDPERGNVMCCYAPESSTFVVKRMKPILEELLGEELIPSYWFTTTYHNKGWMNCHTDRPSCEVSVTMNICGDAEHGVAYLGTIVPHWRSPLRTHKNDRFMQLFLHYVRKNGEYADYAYDRNEKCYSLLTR